MSDLYPAMVAAVTKQLGNLLALVEEEPVLEAINVITHAAGHLLNFECSLTSAELQELGTIVETFDRSNPINAVPADNCFTGISKLGGVKVWYKNRAERTMFDSIHQHRLLAVLGSPASVMFAGRIYNIIDDLVARDTERANAAWQHRKTKDRVAAVNSLQTEMTQKINSCLSMAAAVGLTRLNADGEMLITVKTSMIKQAIERSKTILHKRQSPLRMAVSS